MAAPGKSPSGSTTGTAGGSSVHGGSVSNSPAPITPERGRQPRRRDQHRAAVAVRPATPPPTGTVDTNTPTDSDRRPADAAVHGLRHGDARYQQPATRLGAR